MISTHTTSTEDSPRLDRKQFGYIIHDVARLLRRQFDAEAQRHGLTLPQWRMIAQLSHGDGISQAALASCLDTDPMTVSGLVERLEHKGLVVRVADPDDSRAKIVLITDKARAMVAQMKQLAESVFAQAFDGITDAERATTLKVLQQMSANLSRPRAPVREEMV